VAQLAYEGQAPDAGELAKAWHRMLDEAREIVALLPPAEVGTCVLAQDGSLLRARGADLARALEAGGVRFHRGSIRGALPTVVA
jgi:hypothetical protein